MRNILRLIAVFVLSFTVTNWAIAGFPPVRIGGLLQALKTKFTLLFPNNSVVMKGGVKAYVDTGNKSHLYDGDFEGDSVATEWSVTNATATVVDTERVNGKQHLNLAVSAAIPSLSQDQTVTVGGSFVASCWIKTDQIDVQFCSRIDGADSVCQNVSSSNKWFKYSHQNFTSDTSTSFGVSVKGLSSITGDIKIDNCELEFGDQTQNVAQSEYLGRVEYSGTASCVWSTTSTTFTNYSAVTACNTPTAISGSTIQAPSTKIPAVVLPAGSPAGTYKFISSGFHYKDIATNYGAYRFSDGVNHSQESGIYANTQTIGTVLGEITYNGVLTSDTIINLQARNNSGEIEVYSNIQSPIYSISVYYHPPQSQIVRQNRDNWFVDVNIGGANPSLSTGNVATYSAITNTSLDMVINEGSDTNVEIPCSGIASTGLTCSGAGEQIGVVFTPPKTDYYDVCFYGSEIRYHANYQSAAAYQLFKTTNDNSANIEASGTRIPTFVGNQQSGGNGNNLSHCATFKLTGKEKTTIRLKYEQSVSTTMTTAPLILADRNAAIGDRDVRFTVRPSLKSGVIVGEFEQIKSTELCEIKAYGNSGDTISGSGAEAIPWEIVLRESGCVGAWNNNGNTGNNTNDNFTAPRDGWYMFSFSFRTTSSFNLDPRMTENGVDFIHLGSAANSGVTTVNTFNRLVYLTAGNNYAVTIPNGGSYVLNNANSDSNHTMHIREIGDIAAIVKNLNDNKNVKCQTKILSASVTANGSISDLQFDNLVIGRKYIVQGGIMDIGAMPSGDSAGLRFFHDGSPIHSSIVTSGSSSAAFTIPLSSASFTASTTTMTVDAVSITAPTEIRGDGTKNQTHIEFCELPDNYIETSEF